MHIVDLDGVAGHQSAVLAGTHLVPERRQFGLAHQARVSIAALVAMPVAVASMPRELTASVLRVLVEMDVAEIHLLERRRGIEGDAIGAGGRVYIARRLRAIALPAVLMARAMDCSAIT